jgi:hypothetical protein
MVRIVLFILLCLPGFASAGVYMCVDPATGKKTFTDKACATKKSGDKLDVKPHNFGDSGHRAPGSSTSKAWTSQREATGADRAEYTGNQRRLEKARNTAADAD